MSIISGDEVGIDVNSVNVNEHFIRYSVTMLGYGYMGDLLKDSDNNRWMGPRRYSWSGMLIASCCKTAAHKQFDSGFIWFYCASTQYRS